MSKPTGQAGHTPGLWTVDDGDSDAVGVFADDANAIAYCSEDPSCGGGLRGRKIDAANARLIAAAPDLLAACKALMAARLSVFDGGIVEQTEAERAAEKLAEQAIAKATGKAGGQ